MLRVIIPKLYFNAGTANASIYVIIVFENVIIIIIINNSNFGCDSIGKINRLLYM